MRFAALFCLLLVPACGGPIPEEDRDSTASPGRIDDSAPEQGRALAAPEAWPPRGSLAQAAADAYDVLLHARRFTDDAIYDGGATPREVIALRILLGRPNAAAIFNELFERATVGGRLFALCGLYYADPARFQQGVQRLRESSETVEFQTGCLTWTDRPVAELLDLGAGAAVRLESPAQTIREWKALDEARFSLGYDIVGGGFPDLFRTGGGYTTSLELELDQGVD